MSTTRIVIAGGGIAGVPLAYALKAALHGRAEVIVVSDRVYFHFVPANPWLALGLREQSDVIFALEPLLAARKISLRPQAVRIIHPEDNHLTLTDGTDLSYDYLVLATGVCPDWERVPGAELSAGAHSMILPQDAAAAYGAYREFLKREGPIVVTVAAEAAILGPVYEYAFLLDADLRRRGLRTRVPITLITPEPYPGHLGLDKPVVRNVLEDALKANAINWIGNAAVQVCRDDQLQFTVCDDGGKSVKHDIDFAYAMIWPPFRGVAAVAHCTALADEHGFIPVDDHQRSHTYTNVFALGACAAKPALTRTAVPIGAPDTVHAVQQQVAIVSRNIVHSLHDQPLISARAERERWLGDMGKHGAACLSAPQILLRNLDGLRSGRWVYERRLEKDFINKILFGSSERGQVAALVRRLNSQLRRSSAPAATVGTHLPVSEGMRRELEALARHFGVNGEELGRELLERAVADAVSYLDPDNRQRLADEVRAQWTREREAEQERVRFGGEAT